jgi:1-deoxy-D-xylulose-5-phosphate synthase
MAPKDSQELEDMLEAALQLDAPVSIRYPKGEAYSLGYREKVKIGKAQIIAEGKEVCLIALGSMVKVADEVLSFCSKEGFSPSLVNARFIKPLDRDVLIRMACEHRIIVTLEEASQAGGFGEAVLALYEQEGLLNKVEMLRLGLPDTFIPAAKREDLLAMYGLSAPAVWERIKKILAKESIRYI